MRPSDSEHRDDGDWLERHVVADRDAWADPALQQFRARHPRLVRVTDEVVARLRSRLHETSPQLEAGLAAAKRGRAADTDQRQPPTSPRTTPPEAIRRLAGGHRPRVTLAAALQMAAFGLIVLAVGGVAGVWYAHRAPTAPEISRTYATVAGQQATLTLDDGTRVVLAPATTLRVRYGGAVRGTSVTVDGQALFTVTHHAASPFVVRSGRAMTRVLGTTFMVRRYEHDRVTRVLVFEGRVSVGDTAVQPASRPVVLSAGALGLVSDSGTVRVLSSAVTRDDTAWTAGQLDFRQARVPDVLAELSRAYGVEIRVTDSELKARKITFSVRVNQQSLQSVLDALAAALDAHVGRSDGVITLLPGAAMTSKLKHTAPHSTLESQYGR